MTQLSSMKIVHGQVKYYMVRLKPENQKLPFLLGSKNSLKRNTDNELYLVSVHLQYGLSTEGFQPALIKFQISNQKSSLTGFVSRAAATIIFITLHITLIQFLFSILAIATQMQTTDNPSYFSYLISIFYFSNSYTTVKKVSVNNR